MIDIGIADAKNNFLKVIGLVQTGEEIIVCDKGKKVALIIPFNRAKKKRVLGAARGKVTIKGDINAPLPLSIKKKFFG